MAVIASASGVSAQNFEAENPQCIAPSNPGGGVAFAHVTKECNEDNNLIIAASMSTSARIAQGIYEGAEQNDVHFLATFGAEYGAIAVAADSKYELAPI